MSEFIQPYDFLMLAVLVGSLLVGVWKGMAWQLAALASVFVSGAVAVGGCAAFAPYFSVHDPWDRVLAMLVLYVVTAAAIWILFRFVSKIIDRAQMKEFDRQLGAIFGFAKGVVYCILITFFAATLSESARQVVLESRSGDYLARAIRRAKPILPVDVHALLGKYIDELDERLHAPPSQPPKPVDALPSAVGLGQSIGWGGAANAGSSNATANSTSTDPDGAGGAAQTPPIQK
jgi:membrane protein required for colicin V production